MLNSRPGFRRQYLTCIRTGEGWLHLAAIRSMSRKGDCWDNTPMESFVKTLEAERVDQADYATRDEARRDVSSFIETFCNRQRLHSAIGYILQTE